jgi:hypothetical protein
MAPCFLVEGLQYLGQIIIIPKVVNSCQTTLCHQESEDKHFKTNVLIPLGLLEFFFFFLKNIQANPSETEARKLIHVPTLS